MTYLVTDYDPEERRALGTAWNALRDEVVAGLTDKRLLPLFQCVPSACLCASHSA